VVILVGVVEATASTSPVVPHGLFDPKFLVESPEYKACQKYVPAVARVTGLEAGSVPGVVMFSGVPVLTSVVQPESEYTL
jgi:hypothetical protein